MNKEFDPWVALEAYLADEIEPAEAEWLRAWIDANPQVLPELAELGDIHVSLASSAASRTPPNILARILEEQKTKRSWLQQRRGFRLAAAVFILGAITGITLFLLLASPPAVATVTSAEDVVWKSAPIQPGQEIPEGEIRIAGGRLGVRLASGTLLQVRGETDLKLVDLENALLKLGATTFNCPPEAQGFKVELPGGNEVVDLGTEFHIEVAANGAAKVSVLSGSVAVRVPDERPPMLLTAGNFVTLQPSGRNRIGAVAALRDGRRWREQLEELAQRRRTILVAPLDGMALPLKPAGVEPVISGQLRAVPDRFGNPGGAVRFDGKGTSVKYPITLPADMLTISFWLRVDNLEGHRYVVAAEADDARHASRRVHLIDRVLKADAFVRGLPEHRRADRPVRAMGGSCKIEAGQWIHMAASFVRLKGGQARLRLYINGQAKSDNRFAYRDGPDPIAPGLVLGASPEKITPQFFAGEIDDLIIEKVLLSEVAARELYEESRPE